MSQPTEQIPSEMLELAIGAILRSRQLDPDGTLQQNKDDARRDALAALEAADVSALLAQIASMQAWRDAESGDRAALLAEIAAQQASFDLRWQSDQRAIQRWQAAHPDALPMWPDHADLCVWLMALVAELEAELTKVREVLHEQTSYVEEELARVRKDAKRYRWLRSQHWSDAPLAVVRDPKMAVDLGYDLPSLERLDEAIDAAMAKPEGGRGE